MTDRLYYTDPYAQSFDAVVRRVDSRPGGAAVFLDRTAFYPTTGGQPFDTGTLGGVRVVEVIEDETGDIAHIVEGTLHAEQVVTGAIDWSRRFDHMQQHTGQHVLSAAFARVFDARTISFHLGSEVSTIDLAKDMKPEEIAAAEITANRVVWEDRPVGIRFASKEEAAAMPLRKESLRDGTLRLIDVEDWDLSACGGTHVFRTGAIGVIAIGAWERFKGGLRIEFLCGGRALRRFGAMRDVLGATVRMLSVSPQELPGSIERLQGEAKDQKRVSATLQTELARFRAADLTASAQPYREGRLVLREIDADAAGLKALATAVVAGSGFVVLLVSSSAPALIVAARSADVSSMSAQQLVSALVGTFGGRGGGKPELAQAGGLNATPAAILDAAWSLLKI